MTRHRTKGVRGKYGWELRCSQCQTFMFDGPFDLKPDAEWHAMKHHFDTGHYAGVYKVRVEVKALPPAKARGKGKK